MCNWNVGEDNLLLMRVVVDARHSSQSSLSYYSSGAPVINPPASMIGLADYEAVFSVSILDHYYPVVIEPSNPGVQWSDITQELRIRLPKGVHTFTMSASNEKGRTETVLEIYINQCPPQYAYLHIDRPDGNSDYLYFYNDKQNLVFTDWMNGDYERVMCLDPGKYAFNVTKYSQLYSGEYTMNILDEFNDVKDMLTWNIVGDSQIQMITLGDDIPYGSTLKYMITDSPDKNWNTKKYRDTKWKEGITGTWGSFSQSSVYFRKQFSITDISQVSIIHITIQGHDQVTVFLNGIEVSNVDMNSRKLSSYRTTVPSDMISKGMNVICVCLKRTESTKPSDLIDFDLMLKTIPSDILLRAYPELPLIILSKLIVYMKLSRYLKWIMVNGEVCLFL